MYIMGALLRHGSEEQKRQYLPAIAAGDLRLQSFAVTEPTTGTDTTKTKTFAARAGDCYVVNGQKVWISRVQHSDLMLLLARTTPLAEVKKKTEGLSIFIVDLRGAWSITRRTRSSSTISRSRRGISSGRKAWASGTFSTG
jgi:acyl-CoA dehydrogenase